MLPIALFAWGVGAQSPRASTARTPTLAFNGTPSAFYYEIAGEQMTTRPATRCGGAFAQAPQLQLVVAEPTGVQLDAIARNESDLTLAIAHPDGRWSCFDDHLGSTNPSAVLDLNAGTHTVYIGTYTPGQPLHADLNIAPNARIAWEACDQTPIHRIRTGADERFSGQLDASLQACTRVIGATNCLWHLSSLPVVCLDITRPQQLTVTTENATFDTVLAIQEIRPDATTGDLRWLNDDAVNQRGLSAINALIPPGRYAVFVGSYPYRTEGNYDVRVQASEPPRR